MNIKSQKDFFSGLMFMGIGVAFAGGATDYHIGQASSMGPGYFPLCLGILMTLLGVIITFKALVLESFGGDKIGPWAWKPLFFVIAANLVFGVLLGGLPSIGLPPMGLIVAIYAVTFIASMAKSGWTLKATALLATVLAIGSYGAFVLALKLQFTVWPAFITG
ncbi:MAG: tripartite tricarboxylate transporter TctB family protein [Pseudomonadota bacterium]|nr:tripartite tricarboxylate transporter TctB family protein [Pseudomonadota bacterium]